MAMIKEFEMNDLS